MGKKKLWNTEIENLIASENEKIMIKLKREAEIQANIVKQRWETIIKAALIKMNDVGWTLPMVMGIRPIEYISKLDNNKVDDFFCEYFSVDNSRNFSELISVINRSKIEERYKLAVKQCVSAYNSELYILVTNTLMPVIEGILSSFHPDKKNTHMMMICKNNIEQLSVTEEDMIKKYSWESYSTFITKLYTKSSFDKTEPSFINRHWLLHGRSSYDVTKVDCLRLFNAISTICYIVDHKGDLV